MSSRVPLTRTLGASKVVIEVGEQLSALGWRVHLSGPDELDLARYSGVHPYEAYERALLDLLQRRGREFDVIDHGTHLPFPRRELPENTLVVSRSVLLPQHFDRIAIPRSRSLRAIVGHLVRGRRRSADMRRIIDSATVTFREADLINVSNPDDRTALVELGFDAGRICVLPYGLSDARFAEFDAAVAKARAPRAPIVAFVGTMDHRKGYVEFPKLVREIARLVPEARFRLLGTRGMIPDAEGVFVMFPAALRHRIEVIPSYDPEALPALLAQCRVGVFPSHLEGFGFGVLEMLAAALPVVAYDAPGANDDAGQGESCASRRLASDGDLDGLAAGSAR